MKTARLDMHGGVSGDMWLGALLDVGYPLESLRRAVEPLGIGGLSIEAQRVDRLGISAIKVDVRIDGRMETPDSPHDSFHSRSVPHGIGYSELVRRLERADLDASVRRRSAAVFRRIGEAEARIHRQPLDELHFHEVGAADALVDVVGTVSGFLALGIDRLHASSFPLGSGGHIRCSHGRYPNPAPAVLEILKGASTRPSAVESETVTPTGAALVMELAQTDGSCPVMTLEAAGYGAGFKDFSAWGIPNVLRLWIGRPSE